MPALTTISPTALVQPRSVRRALDAMRADMGREWNLTELAALAGVSGRTLQRQFQCFLGNAPRVILRDIRLERARRELLHSSPDARVTDIALRCGFQHCGRFSIEYRRRYAETPSQTLRRQAVFSDAIASMPAILASGPDRPTVTLLPIEASPEHSELARDIADELATALTRAGVAVAGNAGSARYHLTGILRGLGPQTRLTSRLVDAETGRHLWAYRSDDAFLDGEGREDQLAARIAAALQPCLRLAEIDRARRKPDSDLTPQDLALKAMPGVLALDAEGNARALDLLELATDRDPDNALATALAAWARAQRIVYHFSATPVEERTRSADLARKARNLADDATVLAILGNALTALHDLDAAGLVIRKALSVDAGSAWAWSRSGWIDVYRGDSESAIERFNIALDLAPNDPLAFNSFVGIGCAHFNAGRYSDAARWQERALGEHPSATWIHRTLCPAYVLGGDETEARRSLANLREHYPQLTVALVQQGLPPLPHAFRHRVVEALHTVGLPH